MTLRPTGVLVLVLGLTACESGGPSLDAVPPPTRESDGLLSRPDLQAVVDRQVARDADALVAFLASDDADVRARAAFGLGSAQDADAVTALLGLLTDPDASVRRDAAFALGQAGAPDEVVTLLAEALAEESDPQVRDRILEALGKQPTPAAADALLAADVAPAEEARRTVSLARLLAVHGVTHQDALSHLLARLDDPDGDVRWNAAWYLGRQLESGAWVARVSEVRSALDRADRDDPAAMNLVQALGRLRDPADNERMSTWAAEADDWRTRTGAAAGLVGREGDQDVRELLFALLEDPSVHVALTAARVLAQTDHPPSIRLRVRTWIEDHPDRPVVIGPLLALLARQDEREFVFGWIDASPLDDSHRWAAALVALQLLAGEDAVERLVRATEVTDPVIATQAVGALAQRWTRDRADPAKHLAYFEVFLRAVTDGPPRAALQAAPTLADSVFAPFDHARALADAYRDMEAPADQDAMIAVLAALSLTGDPRVDPLLREALEHPDQGVRNAAANGLTRLTGQPVTAPPAPESEQSGEPDPTVIDWAYVRSLGDAPRFVMDTEEGRVVIRLAPEEAPHTVQTIARIAEAGSYDGVAFHRVVPNFVVQGGDFTRGDGSGGPGYAITSEFTLVPFERGVVGMASAGKDTEGSQFFVNHVRTPHLNGGYTAFGWVVEGMDVVDRLVQGSKILTVRIERGG